MTEQRDEVSFQAAVTCMDPDPDPDPDPYSWLELTRVDIGAAPDSASTG